MARETSTAPLLLLLGITLQTPALAQTCETECPQPSATARTAPKPTSDAPTAPVDERVSIEADDKDFNFDVNGNAAAPVYRYLKRAKPGLLGSEAIKWNFTKFLVDRDGKVLARYAPNDTPESIEGDVEKALR